jgi:hypothetical protein
VGRDNHAWPGGVEVARVGPSHVAGLVTAAAAIARGLISVIEGGELRA